MLPRLHRLTRPADFAATVRRGRGAATGRSADRLVVVHHRRTDAGTPPRVGFVVSKAVGNAVTRNRTKRRLRAVAATCLAGLPAGTDLVVRANPAAAHASFAELKASLERQMRKVRS